MTLFRVIDGGLRSVSRCALSALRGEKRIEFFRQDHGYQDGTYIKSGRGERIMNTFRSYSTHWMRPRPDSPRQFMTRCQRVTPP